MQALEQVSVDGCDHLQSIDKLLSRIKDIENFLGIRKYKYYPCDHGAKYLETPLNKDSCWICSGTGYWKDEIKKGSL